jgi:hypothetical protein
MATTGKTRTLKSYAVDLLEYPRWLIERDVDFTNCRYHGHYNVFLLQCVNCQFGPACRWLDLQRTPDAEDASLDELVEALSSAVEYLQPRCHGQGDEHADTRAWIREARQFLKSRRY